MDRDNCDLASTLVSKTYIEQGSQALTRRSKLIKSLLSQRRLPEQGWDDATLELFIQDAALMDSNNFVDNVGVGEREARVASELVARRHYRLAHGIGRSGDVSAEQPKAAGSSLLVKLTNLLAEDALEVAGLQEVGAALVLPLATGMAITTTLLALRSMRPPTARYVLWPRVDQKTCLKSITAAGFEVVPIPMQRLAGVDELTTDVAAIQRKLEELGASQLACVITTTSCFAPRASDDVVAVAKLCQAAGVAHIVNNAYGVQARGLCAQITSAWRKGRVDCVVQSTDKNFMVPVGGAIVAARRGHTDLVERVNTLYPGRASMAPLLDLLITLLHWGASGWRHVLQQREELYAYALQRLQAFAAEVGERVLDTPGNPISLALTLKTLTEPQGGAGGSLDQRRQQQQQGQQPHTNTVLLASWGDPGTVDGLLGRTQEPTTTSSSRQEGDAGASDAPPDSATSHTGGVAPEAGRAVGERPCKGGSSPGGSPEGGGTQAGQQEPATEGWPGAAEGEAAAAAAEAEPPSPAACPRPAGPAVTLLGSMLFKRCVSGTRVVARGKRQSVGGQEFRGYGAHCNDYPCDYLTLAAVVGTTRGDIDEFVARARQCFAEFKRKQSRQQRQ